MAATVKRSNIVSIKTPLKRAPKPNNQRVAKNAQWYRFNDRDSELNALCEIIIQSGVDSKEIADRIIKQGGSICFKTIDKWLSGETRKAYNPNMRWVGFVLGKTRRWIDDF